MQLAPVVARLTDTVPALKLVGGAAQFERAQQGLSALPAAFVLPLSETAGENPFMSQGVEQRVAANFGVVLAIRNLADGTGAAAIDDLEDVRQVVRNALIDPTWIPDGCTENCEFASGELSAFANGVLWWTDSFRTAYQLRSA